MDQAAPAVLLRPQGAAVARSGRTLAEALGYFAVSRVVERDSENVLQEAAP
jgi:hypothetical protein